jgi:protein phosphatase
MGVLAAGAATPVWCVVNLAVAAVTDPGRVREHNEDALLVRPEKLLFAVADGMGGHVAGEVASALAVSTLDEAIADGDGGGGSTDALAAKLVEAVRRANERILERGRREPATRGMGTTLTVVAFADPTLEQCALAHVGDSRAYRYRGRRLELLTRDHTWVQDEVDAGRLHPDEARGHPYSNVLSRVLGVPELEGIEAGAVDLEAGDVLLLCSDGLTAMLDEAGIAAVLAGHADLDQASAALVEAANARGGVDNITVLLLRVD